MSERNIFECGVDCNEIGFVCNTIAVRVNSLLLDFFSAEERDQIEKKGELEGEALWFIVYGELQLQQKKELEFK